MKGKEMFTEEEVRELWEKHGGLDWVLDDPKMRATFVDFANALPVKREGEPIDPKDIRVGDIVMGTIARQCSEYSRGGVVEGVVYQSGIGRLCVTGWYVDALDNLRLLHRPAPKLRAGQVIRVDAAAHAYLYLVGLEFYVLSIPDGSRSTSPTVEMRGSTGVSYGVSPDAITDFTVLWPTEES